ncbi:hypothetical protein EVJ58_g1962 [Rhodofomes roseus]|uniref:HAT C-terminal dimerisation domain-containing protein n=1 Tax=Rhodofomes roseus TaxID=34475 RepID=A0A4Y9YV76_9APHY|nr:hypothetical protein EVJ58_g1962 [Rhodofomes roseus]
MPTSSASSGPDSPAQPSGPETRPATPNSPGEPTNNENATSESGTDRACDIDYKAVELELERYLKDNNIGTIDEGADLYRYWGERKTEYPYMYRVALDVLPAQASAVSCERMFSSSKETDTLRRNRLSPEVMEALQILKYFYKQERLNFASQLLAREDDYTIEGPITEAAMDELLRTGQYEVLEDLIRNSKEQAVEMA